MLWTIPVHLRKQFRARACARGKMLKALPNKAGAVNSAIMRPLNEADLLKPGKLPSEWWRRLNKVHRNVLPQIYGEGRLILRANPLWKKPGNRETAAKVEKHLFQSR